MPIVATLSFCSLGISLAAKDIIQAFLHGITLLFEEDLYIGEFVSINGMAGTVEKLSVRVIHIREKSGTIHTMPYHLINSVSNFSRDYAVIFEVLRCDVKDITAVSNILIDTVKKMKDEPEYESVILGDVIIRGIKPFDLTGIRIFWELKMSTTFVRNHLVYAIYGRLVDEFKKQKISIPIAESIEVIASETS
jgi:small conductance mechanosensitive channel